MNMHTSFGSAPNISPSVLCVASSTPSAASRDANEPHSAVLKGCRAAMVLNIYQALNFPVSLLFLTSTCVV